MLEKCRILQYHIFGSVLAAPAHIKSFLKIDDVSPHTVSKHRYLSTLLQYCYHFQPIFENNGHVEASISLEELDKSLGHIFSEAKKYEFYRFIGGIFCLSKITFDDDENGHSFIDEMKNPLKLAAELLAVDCKELTSCLTHRTIKVPGESSYIR